MRQHGRLNVLQRLKAMCGSPDLCLQIILAEGLHPTQESFTAEVLIITREEKGNNTLVLIWLYVAVQCNIKGAICNNSPSRK